MHSNKILLLTSMLGFNLLHAGNDVMFQPRSLLTTCLLVVAKNYEDSTQFDVLPAEIKDPLCALHLAHQHQEFSKKGLLQALCLCAPFKTKEYFINNPDCFDTLCWVIKHDAHNNLDDALILMSRYKATLIKNKRDSIVALLSLGANINAKGTTKEINDLTPLVSAIQTKRPEIVKFLIAQGSQVNLKSNGKTPLQHAKDDLNSIGCVDGVNNIINLQEIVEILYKNDAQDSEEKISKQTTRYKFCYLT